MSNYMETYKQWCTDPYFDADTKAELKKIEGDQAEIEDRFYRQLEFGTGGLRGVIGAGTNRMNIYTVRQATQGLANYIISQNGQEKGVAIAHDSRIMSPEFTEEAALCLNANGIKAYVFDSLRPTPELSFAVRELGCISGIVITASHNPREYNGYKVYWEDGAQITPPHDKNILAEVAKVTSFDQVKTMAKEEAVAAGLYNVIGKEIDDRYMEELKKQSIHPEIIKEMAKDIKIVYTPLHGTGNLPVRRVTNRESDWCCGPPLREAAARPLAREPGYSLTTSLRTACWRGTRNRSLIRAPGKPWQYEREFVLSVFSFGGVRGAFG